MISTVAHDHHSRIMWFLADVVGLFSNNVGPFSRNVGRIRRIFSANVGPNRPMLSGRGIYVLRSLQLARLLEPSFRHCWQGCFINDGAVACHRRSEPLLPLWVQ